MAPFFQLVQQGIVGVEDVVQRALVELRGLEHQLGVDVVAAVFVEGNHHLLQRIVLVLLVEP